MANSALLLSVCMLCASTTASWLPQPNQGAVQELAVSAAVRYNLHSADNYAYKVTEILHVQTKIDGGIVYSMDVILGRTQCLKGKDPNLESCKLFTNPPDAKSLKCLFVVLSDPLNDDMHLQDSSCQPTNQKDN